MAARAIGRRDGGAESAWHRLHRRAASGDGGSGARCEHRSPGRVQSGRCAVAAVWRADAGRRAQGRRTFGNDRMDCQRGRRPARHRARRQVQGRRGGIDRGRRHRRRARSPRRRLHSGPGRDRQRRSARRQRADSAGQHVPLQNPRADGHHRQSSCGDSTTQARLPRRRVGTARPQPRQSGARPVRRADGAISGAGRAGRAGHRRDRDRQRGRLVARSAAARHRHAQGAGCDQRRYRADPRARDRRGGVCRDRRGIDRRRGGHPAARYGAGQPAAGRAGAGDRRAFAGLRRHLRTVDCRHFRRRAADPRARVSRDGADARAGRAALAQLALAGAAGRRRACAARRIDPAARRSAAAERRVPWRRRRAVRRAGRARLGIA